MEGLILLAIIVPIAWGIGLLLRPADKNRKTMLFWVSFGLAVTTLLSCGILFLGDMELYAFSLGENMKIYFRTDSIGRMFQMIVTLVVPLVGMQAILLPSICFMK